MQIQTQQTIRKVSVRKFDWSAIDSDSCEHIGFGATEQEAISDLLYQVIEETKVLLQLNQVLVG